MGDVAMPKEDNAVGEDDLKVLDGALEEWRGRTEIPKEFVIPGESRPGALLDVARSVARRAERSLSPPDTQTSTPTPCASSTASPTSSSSSRATLRVRRPSRRASGYLERTPSVRKVAIDGD